MEDRPDCKYFIELLKRRRSSANVSERIAGGKEEAIAPMSASYA
jgi:hypothetical protein